MASVTTKKSISFAETMDLGNSNAIEVTESKGKGGQLVKSAMIEVRKKDGTGTELIAVNDEKAIITYGKIATLTAIREKTGIALCYELAIVRDNKLYTEFGMESFGEWAERTTGLSAKSADIYARVGSRFVEAVEIDGKTRYGLKFGLAPYESFITVGHLIELTKLFANERKIDLDSYDIPLEFRESGFSMYLSTKDMRDAVKKILGEVKINGAIREETPADNAGESQADNNGESQADNGEESQVGSREEKQTETSIDPKESAKITLANTQNAVATAIESIKDFLSDKDLKTLNKLVVELSKITI